MAADQRARLGTHGVLDPPATRARRRSALLAAARCFARRGYDATALDHIAAEPGATSEFLAVRDLAGHILRSLDQYAGVLHEPCAQEQGNRRRMRERERTLRAGDRGAHLAGDRLRSVLPGHPPVDNVYAAAGDVGMASCYAPEGPLQTATIVAGVTRQVLAGVPRAGNEAAADLLAALEVGNVASADGGFSATNRAA